MQKTHTPDSASDDLLQIRTGKYYESKTEFPSNSVFTRVRDEYKRDSHTKGKKMVLTKEITSAKVQIVVTLQNSSSLLSIISNDLSLRICNRGNKCGGF